MSMSEWVIILVFGEKGIYNLEYLYFRLDYNNKGVENRMHPYILQGFYIDLSRHNSMLQKYIHILSHHKCNTYFFFYTQQKVRIQPERKILMTLVTLQYRDLTCLIILLLHLSHAFVFNKACYCLLTISLVYVPLTRTY